MTLTELRQYVRDLTGLYSTDILPDALITRWLQETYSEVNRAADWPWLEVTASGSLSIGVTNITLQSKYPRVQEVTLQYPNGVLYQVPSRLFGVQTVDGDDDVAYSVDTSGSNAVLYLSKALTEVATYNVVYLKNDQSLVDSGAQASAMPTEFEPLLAYRAAQKALMFQADDSPRADFYFSEYANLLQTMIDQLTLDNDLGPVQIGGEILRVDTRTVGRVNVRFRSV